jgi:hypothetical protein
MKRYSITVHLENGDQVDAKSVGNDKYEAMARLVETEQFKQFVGNLKISSWDVTFLEDVAPIVEENYILQESAIHPGWWVVTDKVNNVVVQFEKGRFNETAKATPLYDFPKEPVGVATILREVGEYIALYHSELS